MGLETVAFLSLSVSVAWGIIGMKMAENRGRNENLGFVTGFFLGLFAVIYYWIAGDTLKEKARKEVEIEKYKRELKS
jgi:hypothetical protein